MKQPELKIPLRVSNIVMTGKIPTLHKLDFTKFISSLDDWFVINEETSPIVQKRYERQDGTTSTRSHHKCSITVSIWPSGSINIVGLRSIQEGEETLNKVIKEIQAAGIL